MRGEGKSMRIKRNKCVEMKREQKGAMLRNQLASEHDHMAKPCVRAVVLTFSLSECVLYALCVLVNA